jgi:hypothetical protein
VLAAVDAVSPNDIWAVGVSYSDDSPNSPKVLSLHWDGAQWSVVPNPGYGSPYAGAGDLYSVAAPAHNYVLTVGNRLDEARTRLLWVGQLYHNICPAESCPARFADLPPSGEGSTFFAYARCLVCRGVVSGYACGGAGEPCNDQYQPYYRPGVNVTRGQLSKIVANSAGMDDAIAEGQQFADVPPGSPFYEYVERLAQTGAISGYPCGGVGEVCDWQNRPYFRPNSPATRGQISKIVATAAGFEDVIPPEQQTFTDVPPTSPFWVYIERLAARQIISGYNDASRCPTGTPCFRYNDNTTRGQMAKIAANAFFPGCQTP